MPRNSLTALQRLAKLEEQKKNLVVLRKNELLAIMEKYNALTIDDSVFTGFLMFITNKDNKDSPILKEFKELAKHKRIPSK